MDWASTKWMAITNITPDQYGNTSIGIYSYSLMVCTYLNKNHLRHVQIQTKVIGLLDLTCLIPTVLSELKRGGYLSSYLSSFIISFIPVVGWRYNDGSNWISNDNLNLTSMYIKVQIN